MSKTGGFCMKTIREQPSKLKWFLLIAGITVGVYLGFRYLLPLILPFAVAYFLAWIIRPVTESLYQKWKIPRIIGGTFSLLLLVGIFGTAFFLLVNVLIREAIAFLKNIPVYLAIIADKLDKICGHWDKMMGYGDGTLRAIVDDNLVSGYAKIKSNIMPKLTEHTISITFGLMTFMGVVLIVLVAAILIVKDLPEFHKRYDNNSVYKDIHKVTSKLSEAGLAYLRSQLIIMIIVAGVCVLALFLIKNDYAVLGGVGIAVMDALPVLGSGIALIPWAIIMLVNGNIYAAAILMTAYLLCQIIREVLEPKLIGNRIGVKPLYTLISMYVGLKLFGVAGFILGPIGLVIITTIYQAVNDKIDTVANGEDISYNEK
jgi:sporulation integral membrane protein YtvI